MVARAVKDEAEKKIEILGRNPNNIFNFMNCGLINCGSYSGVKLPERAKKIQKRVVERKMLEEIIPNNKMLEEIISNRKNARGDYIE